VIQGAQSNWKWLKSNQHNISRRASPIISSRNLIPIGEDQAHALRVEEPGSGEGSETQVNLNRKLFPTLIKSKNYQDIKVSTCKF
jgi:hypothetical protein